MFVVVYNILYVNSMAVICSYTTTLTSNMSETLVEGVGNEVLVALLFGFVSVLILLAWYSTNLTSSQARLTNVRVQRRGITLNRLPGSSTAGGRSAEQVCQSSSHGYNSFIN